jgi:hypothetical protein
LLPSHADLRREPLFSFVPDAEGFGKNEIGFAYVTVGLEQIEASVYAHQTIS